MSPKKAAKTVTETRPSRNTPESLRLRAVVPRLTVRNVSTSIAWYRDVMGFAVEAEVDDSGRSRGAILKAGIVEFLLVQREGDREPSPERGEGVQLTCVTAQPLDALAERVKSHGGTVIEDPAEGIGHLLITDPDGFQISIVGSSPES